MKYTFVANITVVVDHADNEEVAFYEANHCLDNLSDFLSYEETNATIGDLTPVGREEDTEEE